ncbi:hypothetical protein [Phytoactinopolyspora limicola]|uniref:hypothetical protein n=1 Tax=Phytoactinopolyspora limicola TaxID=2715536 RepID=UPI001A9C8AA3|nr:hypothetical protein [Phytoactinopolyspora limicola]
MRPSRRQRAAEALAKVAGTEHLYTALEEFSLPVLPAFHGLLSGLPRGQVVSLDAPGALALALLAGASQEGSWSAVVGLPELGAVAAADLGCDLDRVLLVDRPADRWADVTAALLEAVDIVLLQPPARPQAGIVRRLTALARRSGCALITTGGWDGASVRLRVESSSWLGVQQGHGHLHSRRVKVVAEGRRTGGRPRSAWLWLPGPDGSVSSAELASVTNMSERQASTTTPVSSTHQVA